MEFKNPRVASRAFSVVVVVLVLLISPCCSKDKLDLKNGEEIDQIDYKGPETHPFIPPPSNTFGPHSSSTNPLGRKAASNSDQGNVRTQKP